MGNIFSGSEIVEIGIQIEVNGRDFYNTLMAQSKSDDAKEIYKLLSSEEEKHIEVFKMILDAVEKYQPQEAYPGEYFDYMNALAGEHVFTQKDKGKEVAKTVKSDKQAIDMGIGFEKDSIIFYDGIKKVVPDYDHKLIDSLIAQEKTHLRKLYNLKKKLK